MSIELKPCPFCGSEAEIMGDQYPYVECQECAAGFTANHSYEFDRADAASKWNARAQGDAEKEAEKEESKGDFPLKEESLIRKAARAQGDAEPVAYISHTSESSCLDWFAQFDAPRHTPLYTHPPKAQAVPSRNDLISLLLATQNESEGVTADLILGMIQRKQEGSGDE